MSPVRVAVFRDIYHIPEWRLCMVQGCPEILRRPAFMCLRHVLMVTAEQEDPDHELH